MVLCRNRLMFSRLETVKEPDSRIEVVPGYFAAIGDYVLLASYLNKSHESCHIAYIIKYFLFYDYEFLECVCVCMNRTIVLEYYNNVKAPVRKF